MAAGSEDAGDRLDRFLARQLPALSRSRIQQLIKDAEARTAGNTGLTVTIAANYGGRWDLLQAMRKMLARSPSRTSRIF